MRDIFIDEFMTSISNNFSPKDLLFIKNNLILHACKYEITERCTDLIVVEEIPKCVKTYLVSRKIEGLSDNTLKLYALRLRQFFEAVPKMVDQIDADDIRVYLFTRQQQTKISDRTLDGIRICICTFFKWAAAEGYIQKDPSATIRKIRYEEKQRGHLSELEIELLRDSCINKRDKAMIELLYSTGCRVSEVMGMNISDVDLNSGEIVVKGKGKKYRTVYLNMKAKLALQKYLDSRTDNSQALFVSLRQPYAKLGKRAIEVRIAQLGVLAGITKHVYPHLIRHTTATHAIERHMDVTEIQKLLGHSKLDTTMIYAKVADNAVKLGHRRCIV